MSSKAVFLGMALRMAGAAALAVLQARAQELTVKLVTDSIRIDGMLVEPHWQYAGSVSLVRNHDPAGGAPRAATRVLAAWSQTHLYVAFQAESRDIRGTYTGRDDPLYNQDVLEIFLDPDGDGRDYLEFEWNCLNTLLDLRCRGIRDCDASWSPAGVRSAVRLQGTANQSGDVDTGWTLEIAIPWAELPASPGLPPNPGGRLPANFYRIDRPTGSAQELTAWAPTGVADFHRPDKFGVLVFAGSTGIRLSKGPKDRRAGAFLYAGQDGWKFRADGRASFWPRERSP